MIAATRLTVENTPTTNIIESIGISDPFVDVVVVIELPIVRCFPFVRISISQFSSVAAIQDKCFIFWNDVRDYPNHMF